MRLTPRLASVLRGTTGALLLLPLLFSGAEAGSRERARLWLEELDDSVDRLCDSLPELSDRMDDDRLRAVAELLELPSWRMLAPESENGSGGHQTSAVLDATGPEWRFPEDGPALHDAEKDDPSLFMRYLNEIMQRKNPLIFMESVIAGLDSLSLRHRRATEEARSAYMRCVWLLSRYEALEYITSSDKNEGEDSSSQTQAIIRRALRQDTLLAALDAALSHRLRRSEAWPLHIIRAALLLDQSRPQAALASLEKLEYAPDSEEHEKRLKLHGFYLRASALMRTGNFALAGRDLDSALKLNPEDAELRLARGTLLRLRGEISAMCGDLHAACAGGLCEGLEAARAQGYCGADALNPPPAALLELKR